MGVYPEHPDGLSPENTQAYIHVFPPKSPVTAALSVQLPVTIQGGGFGDLLQPLKIQAAPIQIIAGTNFPAAQFLFCKFVEHQTEGGFGFSMLR